MLILNHCFNCMKRNFVVNNYLGRFKSVSFENSIRRHIQSSGIKFQQKNPSKQNVNLKSTLNYLTAIGLLAVGLSYAAVPLYRIFCQSYGYGGTVGEIKDSDKVENLKKNSSRIINVKFNSDVGASMVWKFKPQQSEIKVVPGETVLAFYTATNPTNQPITGISTYNVIPFEAGPYFNKIQCFCFEEQQLNPHEEVDMPVFFYIDPEFCEDPKMELVDEIVLSYTFFEAREGVKIPVPSFFNKHSEKQIGKI